MKQKHIDALKIVLKNFGKFAKGLQLKKTESSPSVSRPVSMAKFSEAPFSQNTSGRLFLY